MDHQKISRNPRSSAEGVKIKVKSTSGAPPLVEERNRSIYEIDILSSFDFHKNNKKERIGVPIKMSLEKKRQERQKNCDVFMESYYPTVQEIHSKVKGISFKKKKMDSEIQTDLNFDDRRQEEKEKEASNEKADQENQSPSEGFEEFLKNIILQNLIMNDNSGMKILFKNKNEKWGKNELHVHHHEHHHHYYLNNSAPLDENASPLSFNKIFNKSDGESKVRKNRKCQTGKDRITEKSEPTIYYFKCPFETNLTTKKNSGAIQESENDKSLKDSKTNKVKEKKSSETFEFSRLKLSTSADSVLSKRSDFITTHIYSDMELKANDSRVLYMATISELQNELKDDNNNYKSILNDLKNFNHFIPPKVIADQIASPEISYIRCECASFESSSPGPNDLSFYDIKISAADVENEEKTHSSERKSGEGECAEKGTGQHDPEIWVTKLKTELEKIKKELKRVEEKHFHKRKPFISMLNNNKSIERARSSHNVTVYSSKTFIVGADSLYATQFEEEVNYISKIKLPFEDIGNEREKWHYREKSSFFERTVLN